MVSVAILFAVGLFAVLAWRVAVGPGGATEIRIGYSTLTPLHCALGEVLASTDILARHGLRGTFTGFEHGKDQHESCAQGVVDATFSCEVPAMVHLDRLPGMVLEGSPGELGEIALVVPADSPIRSIADLDGRTLALLGGASSELVVEQWLAEDGLWRDRDVRCEMHGGIGESAVAAVTGGQVDAAVLWDPWLSKAQQEHGLRVVRAAPFWSVVAFFDGHAAVADTGPYLAALGDALSYVADHPDAAADLVAARSGIPREVVLQVLRKNRHVAGEPVDLTMDPDLQARLRDCEAFAHRTGRVSPTFRLVDRLRALP